MRKLADPILDLRYLLERGYPRESAVNFVSNHYRLPLHERHLLSRCVFSKRESSEHMRKKVRIEHLRGRTLGVDGYNVLITAENVISGKTVIKCDDGFIRDLSATFGKYRMSAATKRGLREVLGIIRRSGAREVFILFDRQVSRSGDLALMTEKMMRKFSVPGHAMTAGAVDFLLKEFQVVATSDSAIIKSSRAVWDIPAEMRIRRNRIFDLTKIR
jgi:hypothetical protein